MIIVPIVLHSAITGKASPLGTIFISNDGTGSLNEGNYKVKIIGKNGKEIRLGLVTGYRRKARPVFELVLEALQAVGYKSKGARK